MFGVVASAFERCNDSIFNIVIGKCWVEATSSSENTGDLFRRVRKVLLRFTSVMYIVTIRIGAHYGVHFFSNDTLGLNGIIFEFSIWISK